MLDVDTTQAQVKKGESVASGTFWNALNLAITLPLGVISFSLISHKLGVTAMGRYSFLIWLNATLIGLLVGPANAATKYVAELRSKGEAALAGSVLIWLLRLQVAFGLIMVAIAVLVTVLNALTGNAPPFLLEYVLPVVAAAITLTGGVMVGTAQAERFFRALSLTNIAFAALQFLLTIAALIFNGQVEGLLLVLVASSVLYTALNWRVVRQTGLLNQKFARTVLSSELRREISGYVWSVAGSFALSVVVWQDSEVFFLKLFSNQTQIGYYSAAFGLSSRLILLPDLVFAAFLPSVFHLYAQKDFKGLAHLHHQTLRYLLLASTPLALGGILWAGPIVRLFNGIDFAVAALPLALLLFSGLLVAPGKLAVAILMAADDRNFIRNLTLLAASINLILAAGFVIIGWGAIGAAFSSVVAQFGVLITIGRAARLIKQPFAWWVFVKNIVVATIAFGLGSLWLKEVSWLNLIIAGVTAAVIYALLLPLFGLFTSTDATMIWLKVRGKLARR